MDDRHASLPFAMNGSSANAVLLSSINAFEGWNNCQLISPDQTDTTLRLDSPGFSDLHNPSFRGTKRKWNDIDVTGVGENPSLVLGLGRPSSSTDSSRRSYGTVCTMSSTKETDEETSFDLGLTFDLNLGAEKSAIAKKHVPEMLEPMGQGDLQLSLSFGQSESVVTALDRGTVNFQDKMQAFIVPGSFGPVQTVDEGSTSSRWKQGNKLLPYLNNTSENAEVFSNQATGREPPVGQNVYPSTATPAVKRQVASASRDGNVRQGNCTTKRCQFPECPKGARGASGLCIAHGGGRRCQKAGCHKGAEGRTIFCKAHGGGRRCQYLGCTKSAEGRTDYCIAHGGGRRCSHEDCSRAARGKSGLCIKHGGGKRCQMENCNKSAEGQSGLCISHGGGRRCKFTGCTKGAQGSTNFCKAHGGGKRCTYLGCTKGAEGSTSLCKGHGGGKRCTYQGGCSKSVHGGTQFCVAHGGGKRCAVPECTKSARGRTDFCVRHGGGKRCKYAGCDKSAQGSTDFCKAHGGGKRCSWGQLGSTLGVGHQPCDRFARGKNGLCTTHSALLEDHRVHGELALKAAVSDNPAMKAEKMKGVTGGDVNFGDEDGSNNHLATFDERDIQLANSLLPNTVAAPEGRVHGGSLMAMLAGNYRIQFDSSESDQHIPNAYDSV